MCRLSTVGTVVVAAVLHAEVLSGFIFCIVAVISRIIESLEMRVGPKETRLIASCFRPLILEEEQLSLFFGSMHLQLLLLTTLLPGLLKLMHIQATLARLVGQV